jgi:phosphohistidine phosphatase
MRHLWVIRHAKSAEGDIGQSDHDRPLNARGKANGLAMQHWLAAQEHPAQWVWSSSAVRARQTAQFVVAAFHAELMEERALYLANPEAILDCLRTTDNTVTSAAVVAHNPGMTHLVNALSGRRITDNLVTFGTALFAFDDGWPDLTLGNARFLSLQTPKGLKAAR